MTIFVKTKDQLKQAIKNKEKEIAIDDNDLAKNVVKFKQINKLSKRTLGLLLAATGIATVGFALAPTTGGTSAVAGGISSGVIYSIALASGTTISTSAIIAIGTLCILGSAILLALWKDYEVEIFSTNPWHIKLTRK
jgi:hypothetical protein